MDMSICDEENLVKAYEDLLGAGDCLVELVELLLRRRSEPQFMSL